MALTSHRADQKRARCGRALPSYLSRHYCPQATHRGRGLEGDEYALQ